MRSLFSALILLSSIAFAKPQISYTGPTSQEGTIKFSAHVDLKAAALPTEDQAREAIRQQLLYLIGNMQYGVGGVKGTPSMGYQLSNIRIQNGAQFYRVTYDVVTKAAIEKPSKAGTFNVDLPNDPSAVEKLDRELCTDSHDEPMWYGFNPREDGCPLVEGQDFTRYKARLALTPNTQLTYPEYDKLVTNGRTRMDVLLNSEIERAGPYVGHLRQHGFTEKKWSTDEITTFLGFTPVEMPSIEEFTKGSLTVRFFFGPARVENLEPAKAFHYFYKDALENANVVVYNGHSGLGSNIDLALIEKNENFQISLKKDYQLYFLGGCITYSYYADKYLARKASPQDPRGTKELDIIGFGQESPGFDSNPLIVVSDAIEQFTESGTRTSYQDITSQVDYSWFGVVGDEDNQ